ncbi:hypothetical protein [Streptomyces sp. NBC_00286]|uniref:hypothetical protein n=1 Tax=Streptomyces sp. NBC_00286 TaxID=2975701 RepID=UPI002E27D0E8|nr:hypothetical protein [Streptomyces sp. NBC_00286]
MARQRARGSGRGRRPVGIRPKSPWRLAAWWCAVLACFGATAVLGSLTTSVLGWTGASGTLTVRECHEGPEARGGARRICTGRFVSDDGRVVDNYASLAWDDGHPGAERHVQTTFGGYQARDAHTSLLATSSTVLIALVGLGCTFAALPAGPKLWVVTRLFPTRLGDWYVRVWQ